MDRLSSCYFCGAALDASLSEYPVVPKSLQTEATPDQQVTLCPTCRRKLATVLKRVVAAADEDPDDQSGLMDESGMEPQPDPMAVGDASETGESESDVDEEGLLDTEDDASSETAPDRTHPMAGADEPADTDERSETTPTGTASSGTAETTGTQAGSASESTDSRHDTADEASDDGPSLTRLEYSKVMRLLQNRQLPVDRDEIRAVAVNAYDIEPEEFDAIIDAAVDRGLIAEENGQFVETE
ncbi:hypothetical protein EGH21_13060 [Halomicroarcula sp. F13]|uniref:Uncharacterized protein n=1 Tax=Haloarcula rubra TaxID=2487747 RepID=A0AAW4PRZ1_9EURY|nr:hypothetical protein [Halomicroarcula rubra]MBX0323961.1 hypothetical protein [Halomicroarcula rubra]